MLDDIEETELGVATWLKGESAYLVDGVMEGAYIASGGVALKLTPTGISSSNDVDES